jgi:tripartite-type tricarboxylate transporter receptor subunit TctC
MHLTKRLLSALVAYMLFSSAAAFAAFPERSVRIIVPFAPGGVTDLAARLLGQQLSAKWGQPVVIENRAGAGGLIGVDAAIRSPADGYTILMSTNGEVVIHPAASQKPRFNSVTDLIPIAMATTTPYAWAANVKSGYNSLAELVAAAKANPGSLTFPSAGLGSTMHLATEQFAAASGLKMLHVPYRGGAPAATALTSGEVPVGLVALSAVLPLVDSGQVRLLAVTSTARSKILPNVPTVNETGVLQGFQASIWTALFVPKGTPEEIVAKIRVDTLEGLKDPNFREKLAAMGTDPGNLAGPELTELIKREIDDVSKLAKSANIVLE